MCTKFSRKRDVRKIVKLLCPACISGSGLALPPRKKSKIYTSDDLAWLGLAWLGLA